LSVDLSLKNGFTKLFVLFSGVAFMLSVGVIATDISTLNNNHSVVVFGETMLAHLYFITTGYLFAYIFLVLLDRLIHERASGRESAAYALFCLPIVPLVMVGLGMKNKIPLLINVADGYRLALPSAILAVTILVFDIIVATSQKMKESQHQNDVYWYRTFRDALKLDSVIVIGFAFVVLLVYLVQDDKSSSEQLTVFVAAAEIMLFMCSTCVFTLGAIVPGLKFFYSESKTQGG
jgi:hypothetical protein